MSLAREPNLDAWLDRRLAVYFSDLAELIRMDSVAPDEKPALDWSQEYFRLRARTQREPAHPDIACHPDGNHNAHLGRPDRTTVAVEWPGSAPGPLLLFSAHVDVVPAGPEFHDPFEPRWEGDCFVGRGTADTKGNIIMLAAALDYLDEHDLPHLPVLLDLVPEEEIGGNGALSTLLHGRRADGVVVLEPTDLEVFHGHRGCLEFTATVTGRASHMGGDGISAILGAADLIAELRVLERQLIAEASANPAFSGFSRPVQVNVGMIRGGEWHGSMPEKCTLGGSLGFPPGMHIEGAKQVLESLPGRLTETWLHGHIAFGYEGIHNSAYLGDPDSWLAVGLRACVRSTVADVAERRAWSVSCDARLYHDLLGVPVVVFGAGRLEEAHSSHEFLHVGRWRSGVHALVRLLTEELRWHVG